MAPLHGDKIPASSRNWRSERSEPVFFRTSYGEKIDSWNWVGTKYGIETAMSHKFLISKARIVLRSSLPPPENQFLDGIDSHNESMLWNRCLGLLKSLKIRARLSGKQTGSLGLIKEQDHERNNIFWGLWIKAVPTFSGALLWVIKVFVVDKIQV